MGVGKATFQSGGQISQHSLPGAYSRLDFVRSTGGVVSVNNGVIFGDSRGGKPNTLLWFTGPAEAEETLRSGPLLDAVKHAFTPGGGLVPQKIGAVRVNPGTRATRTFLATATTIITATAWDYGLHSNQLKAKLEAGSVSGKKFTIQFQSNDAVVTDNIDRESFAIQYTGAGTAATMSVSKTALTTTVTAGPGGEDLTVTFTSFPNMEDLVNYINDQASYTCTVISGQEKKATNELDYLNAQDIKTASFTHSSDLQALIDVMAASPWIDTAVFNTAATNRELPDNDTAYVYFSGAIDGAYTSTEWTASLLWAQQQDIQFIGTSAEDAATHALIKTHCELMNSVTGKRERQFIVGGAAGETVAQATTRAGNLSSDAGMLAYPGFTHYDFLDYSVTKTWSPAYYAAKLLGGFVALALPEPMTNKDIDVLEWETELTRTEAETLIEGGVAPGIKAADGRLVCGRSITTYQSAALQRNEFSMMRIALFVSRDMRTAMENSFIGKALNNGQLAKIDGVAYGKLSQYYDLGLFNGQPPYWGYKKTVTADQVKIEYDCHLTPPTNFIFVTAHMHVFADVS